MGQGKNKNSASRLVRFLLFFCQSRSAGIIGAHPVNPWLVCSSRAAQESAISHHDRAYAEGKKSSGKTD
jgi:hypothetical protein